MSTYNLEMQQGTNCGGRCIIEMQKKLDFDVMTEFFEVVRDFHNDYKTSNELKNIIISESNECIELLKHKTAEMCSIIDEVFLSRRNQQSSFYRLCHKLARTGSSEENCLPNEPNCICFSEENLEKFNVDVSADAAIKYTSNVMSAMSAIKNLHGELECTKCQKLFQIGRFKSGPVCDCHAPSISSLHKLHEAILDLCDGKNTRSCDDSWYLTCLKRDAEYYRSKSSQSPMPSDESVESFEVISSGNGKPEEGIKMNQGSKGIEIHPLDSDINELIIASDKLDLSDYVTWPSLKTSHSECINKSSCSEIEPRAPSTIDKWLSKPISPEGNCTPNKLDLAEISSSSVHTNKMMGNKYCGTFHASDKNAKDNEELTPADIIKKSFNRYLINANNRNFMCDFVEKNSKLEISPPCVNLKNADKNVCAINNNLSGNCHDESISKMSPSIALKLSLNSYMVNRLESANKWLRT